jgi:hypothetical protein
MLESRETVFDLIGCQPVSSRELSPERPRSRAVSDPCVYTTPPTSSFEQKRPPPIDTSVDAEADGIKRPNPISLSPADTISNTEEHYLFPSLGDVGPLSHGPDTRFLFTAHEDVSQLSHGPDTRFLFTAHEDVGPLRHGPDTEDKDFEEVLTLLRDNNDEAEISPMHF